MWGAERLSKPHMVIKWAREQCQGSPKFYFHLIDKEKEIQLFPSCSGEGEPQHYWDRGKPRSQKEASSHQEITTGLSSLVPTCWREEETPPLPCSAENPSICLSIPEPHWLAYFWSCAYTENLSGCRMTQLSQKAVQWLHRTRHATNPQVQEPQGQCSYPKNKNPWKLHTKVYSIIKTTQKRKTNTHTENLNVQEQGTIK